MFGIAEEDHTLTVQVSGQARAPQEAACAAVVPAAAVAAAPAAGNPLYAWEFTCGFCHSVEDDADLDSLLVCEGGCRRSFHVRCLGLTNLPPSNSLKWSCPFCVRKLRACWLCQRLDHLGNLRRCTHPHCPKFFHPQCLAAAQAASTGGTAATASTGGTAATAVGAGENFQCPFHACGFPDAVLGCGGAVDEHSVFCTKCPAAWHPRCLAKAGGLLLGDNFGLCPSHRPGAGAASAAGVESAAGAAVGGCEVGLPANPRGPAVGWAAPRYVRSSPLGGRGLQEHTDQSGLAFERITRNVWVAERPRSSGGAAAEEEGCSCRASSGGCGEICTNKACFVECSGGNCRVGADCGNRPFKGKGRSKEKVYRVAEMGSKGMGLVAASSPGGGGEGGGIRAGSFIVEYVGEIVTKAEWQSRHGNFSGRHFYVMEFSAELVADATFKGNDARLINHSCDPNAVCEKWTVNGEARLGIFALRDIKEGEEITYDYHFETTGNRAFKCLCGTDKCGGWIGLRRTTSAGAVRSGGARGGEQRGKKSEYAPVDLLFEFWQEKGTDRNDDGTLKTAKDKELEMAGFAAEKLDWYLTFGRSRSAARGGGAAACNGGSGSHAESVRGVFAFLALHIFEHELAFIRARRLFAVRSFARSRRAWGRKILKSLPKNEFADALVLANFLSDDVCARCQKPGLLQWCAVCVNAFHSSCGLSGSRRVGDDWTCASCVRRQSRTHGPKLTLADKWRRREEKWKNHILPVLTHNLNVARALPTKRRKINE